MRGQIGEVLIDSIDLIRFHSQVDLPFTQENGGPDNIADLESNIVNRFVLDTDSLQVEVNTL